VLDVESYTLQFENLPALLADLRGAGASNATMSRPKGLTGKNKISALAAAYETYRLGGRLPATFEVIFAQAWTPVAGTQQVPAPAGISLSDLRAKLPGRKRE
jgi:malonyl-CoA O-methyltransferase